MTIPLEPKTSAEQLVATLRTRMQYIVAVESCTGGALTHTLTDVAGSSEVLRDGFVTYSNEAKIALGVPHSIIEHYSVYSAETALAMARAGLERTVSPRDSTIAVGITGSLSRIDPANSAASKLGEVYIGIICGNLSRSIKVTVDEQERAAAKQVIVQHALDAINNLLTARPA